MKIALGLSDDQTAERHLRRLELMAGLSHTQLSDVAGHLRPERYSAGQTIYQRGTEGDTLYLVDEGRVQLFGTAGAFVTVESSGSFGDSGFLTGEPYDTDAMALTDVTVWALCRQDFEALALNYPILALNFSRVVSRHLRESTQRGCDRCAGDPGAANGSRACQDRSSDRRIGWSQSGGRLNNIMVGPHQHRRETPVDRRDPVADLAAGRGCPIPGHLAAFQQRRRECTQTGGAIRLSRSDGAGRVGRRPADRRDADLHAVADRDTDADRDFHADSHADRDADPDGDLYTGPADRNPGSAHRGARAGGRASGAAAPVASAAECGS